MRNDLHILIVMKTEMRYTAKALSLVAVSEWPGLKTHFRCLRHVFEEHWHHCPVKSPLGLLFSYIVNQVVNLGLGGQCSKTDPWAGAHACYRSKQHLPISGQKWKEPSPTASLGIVWLYLIINSRYRKWEIVLSYYFLPPTLGNDNE